MAQNMLWMEVLCDLGMRSRERALEIFRGTLPPQRSARKDDCLSAEREFSSLQRSEETQGRKISSTQRDRYFQKFSEVIRT